MKKYWTSSLLIIILVSSCNKSLVEKPKSFLNPSQFFNSDAEAIQAVNGAYSTTAFIYGSGTTYDMGYWSALGTDIGTPNTGDAAGFNYQLYTVLPDDPTLDAVWTTLYKGVANCNLVIGGVTGNSKISSDVSKEVLGQALFLRSLYYYWLTCYWGGVPMWLKPLDVDEISGNIPRTSVDSIRMQMVSDLKVATADLPPTWTGADLGRASKWAADMLLCQVYLWQKDWADAANVANEIIEQNGGNNHLLANYGDLWGLANEYNAEDIWEIDFTQNTHSQSFTDRYVPNQNFEVAVPGYGGLFTGYGLITSTSEFLAKFEPGDLREKWYDFNGNGGVTTLHHYVLKQIAWGEPRGNHGLNSVVYRMAGAYLIYAEAENELAGPTSEAYSRINAIRERAGLPDLSGLTQSQFRQAVRNERLHELSFEFHRRWDLNRWGTLVEAVKNTSGSNPEAAANIQSYDTLQPIPSRETSLNPALIQNPGY
ncbi:MAG: RagB/SusD family nutrient uptake outer membrane protein [Ginsengibacter sp.]